MFSFVAVGGLAAATHWSTAVALVRAADFAPLLANVGGWAVALCVSFVGQWRLTFRDGSAPFGRAARRYGLMSLGGFLVNEAAYAALLRWSPWRYDVLLALVLCAIAFATFVLSRFWVFEVRA